MISSGIPCSLAKAIASLKLGAGQAGRVGDHRQHVSTQNAVSGPREISGIDAAGIGDQHAAHGPQIFPQSRFF